jgi:hypothetical protein
LKPYYNHDYNLAAMGMGDLEAEVSIEIREVDPDESL